MGDFTWLREQLCKAILGTSLALAACSGADASPPAPVPPQPRPNFPSCPEGDFCAPVAKLKPFAKGTETKLGCPVELDPEAKGTKPAEMPAYASEIKLDETVTGDKRKAHDATACCYHWFELCPGGRPLIDDGAAVVAPVRAGGWSREEVAIDVTHDAATRERLAAAWLDDAQMEHASIASFARTTLELLAVGAPAALLADAQRAGLDEVAHAELCFAVASRYAGRSLAPGALPALAPRAADRVRLARDTFLEGCVGETISAMCALRAAKSAPADVAAVWRTLAADEAKHAELAWRTLAWLAREDAAIASALHALAAELRAAEPAAAADVADAGAPLPGRLSATEIAAVRRAAWRDVIAPALALVAGTPTCAATCAAS